MEHITPQVKSERGVRYNNKLQEHTFNVNSGKMEISTFKNIVQEWFENIEVGRYIDFLNNCNVGVGVSNLFYLQTCSVVDEKKGGYVPEDVINYQQGISFS